MGNPKLLQTLNKCVQLIRKTQARWYSDQPECATGYFKPNTPDAFIARHIQIFNIAQHPSDERPADFSVHARYINNYGYNFAHYAAKLQWETFSEIIELIEDDINSKDKLGRTYLHIISESGYEGAMDYLLNAGCDITKVDIGGNTALDLAVNKGHTGMVEKLLARTTLPEKITQHRINSIRAAVHYLLDARCDIEKLDAWRSAALHLATKRGDTGMVEKLLARTTLPEKITQHRINSIRAAVHYLLDDIYDIEKLDTWKKNNQGNTERKDDPECGVYNLAETNNHHKKYNKLIKLLELQPQESSESLIQPNHLITSDPPITKNSTIRCV